MITNLKLNTANWFKKQLLLLGLFILAMLPLVGHAQQYPVRIIPVITPPYSLKLSDYAHAPESKLQLQVLMTDLQQPQHHTGIKFFLQAGLNAQPIAQSNEFIIGQKPFLLTPGANITLTSSQIKHLFDPQNLNGLNPQQYASPLPEGLYQFCFQAYDFYTKNNLSEKACASVFLNQYDPPQLNIPQNAEKIQAINPYGNGSGILFQWMPRQVAPNTKYNFILKEIWDTNQSPISAFLASPVLWKEETFAPNLYYSIDKTQLIPGRRYAWQVQAFSSNPFDNFNYPSNNQIQSANYKNNGLSEIFFFDYVENCQTPTFLMAKNKGRGRVEIHWNFLGNPAGLYKIQYRKKGANTPWMHTEAYQNSALINGLDDLTEYEYRVGAVCGNVAISNSQFENNENAYAFSPVQFFTTDSQDVQNNNFQCGVMPAVDISNKEPLRQSLVANDIFTAGDFPVTIIDAQGSNGIFTGTGFIQVPYLADTKIKVAFNNISINSDKKLISGTVETEYDPNESAVHFASTGLGELFGDAGIKDITLDYNVSNVQFIATPPPGKIIIIGDNGKENNDDTGSRTGSTQELPAGRDYTIVDKNGNVWSVDEDGNITSGGTLADGGKSTPQNTDGVDANGSANAITAKGIKVDFENASNSKYAFDKPKKLISNDYKEISGYIIPFKAVENKETEPFIAKISITDDSVKADSLIFKTSKGVAIEAKKIDGTNDFELTLKGTYSYDKEEIQAVIKQNGKYQIAGVFNLVHISPKNIKLNLVPTTGVKIADETIAQIKNIYSKVAINLDITTKPEFDIKDFLVNNKLPTEDEFGDLSTYSQAQNNIISKYMADNKEVGLEYYIFVTDKPSSSGQGGYMRLNGQFGFVFNQSARTIAHELAHGALKLEHPFKQFKNLTKGETSSIMDYAGGIDFIFPEWKQINDPKLKLYAFQGQQEGEFNGGYAIAPNYTIFSVPTRIAVFSENVKNTPNGTLEGFAIGEKQYFWNIIHKTYVHEYINDKGEKQQEKYNITPSSPTNSYIYLFFERGNYNQKYIAIPSTEFYKKESIEEWEKAPFSEETKKVVPKKRQLLGYIINTNIEGNGTMYYTDSKENSDNKRNESVSNNEKNIIDFSGGFTQEQISKMLQDLNLTTSETGIKGRIIITDEKNLQNANEIFNSPKSDEIIILLYIKDANTKEYEIKINAGDGLPQFKNKSFQDILNQITNKKGWFNIDEFWTINFNPITAIFDGLAWLIGQAEIPEKFYNPQDEKYNPFPAQLYGAVSGATLKDTIFGVKDNTFNTAVVEFAYLCGLWNGAVNTVAALPEGASFVVKMITNENDTRTKTFGAINKLSLDTITQMAEQEWQRFSDLNLALKAEKTGRLSIEVVTIVASVTKIGKVSQAVNFIEKLDAVSKVANIAGKAIKPVVNAGSKSVKFALNKGVGLINRPQIKVQGFGCLFPYIEIHFKDKINAIDDFTLQKKVEDAIETQGGIDKLPTDENGIKIVGIELNGEKTPVLIETKEGLAKSAGKSVDKASDLLKKSFGENSKFVRDEKTLNKLIEYLSPENANKLDAIGGEKELIKFLEKYNDAPCGNCENLGHKIFGGRTLDEMLENYVEVKYAFRNHSDLWRKIEMGALNTNAAVREGTQHMLDVFKKNPNKYDPDKIEGLDLQFEEILDDICKNCRYDVKFKQVDNEQLPLFAEFKSYNTNTWANIKNSNKFIKQFKRYLQEKDITKMDDLAYIINERKANINEVKQAFKELFDKNAKEIFEANPNLFNKIKDFDGDLIEKWQDFRNYISDKRFTTDNKLFDFIKTE